MLTSALNTDFYQLTMAYGYFMAGISEEESCFHISFRRNPFKGSYTVAAGLETAIEYVENYKISPNELDFLYGLKNSESKRYFSQEFIDYLSSLSLSIDIDAVKEGTPIFPGEPLVRVKGHLLQCQLLETPLLNIINFQSLIATKAARICLAAKNSEVVEYGLRRAQGFDGGLSASRAAYIGGVSRTSNVYAGSRYNIPLSGTMAHSFIMRYGDEKKAFLSFAKAMPHNSVFLIDTYDSHQGIENAVLVGKKLLNQGVDLKGIRLDSGELLSLSTYAREQLDASGLRNTKIIASNELDEYCIEKLKNANAPIDVFGVGTKLVTAFDDPALGGVYKLAATRAKNEAWRYCIKVSDDPIKGTLPGILQIRRYEEQGVYKKDVIFDEDIGVTRKDEVEGEYKDILINIFKNGKLNYQLPELSKIRSKTKKELKKLAPGIVKLDSSQIYPVIIDELLLTRKKSLQEGKL